MDIENKSKEFMQKRGLSMNRIKANRTIKAMFMMIVLIISFTACVEQKKPQVKEVYSQEQEVEESDKNQEKTENKKEKDKKNPQKEKQTRKEEVIDKKNKNEKADESNQTQIEQTELQQEETKNKEINQNPEVEYRIVATSPATCSIMDSLGLDLVGVCTATVSKLPSRYDNVTQIGTAMSPDTEIIKSLHPTDVIGPNTLETDLKMKYDNIGVHSTFINLKSVQGMYDSITMLGNKYGRKAEAEKLVEEYNLFINDYRAKHQVESPPKVLVLMGLPGSYLVCTNQSYAGSLVELAGGENVFHHDTKDFLNVNTEEILNTDPDIIIRTAHGLPQEALKMFEKEFSTNDIWKHFRAVQEGKVYDVDYMKFGMSATFDYPEALSDLEPILYGE